MPTKSASRIITRGKDWLGPAIPPGEILLEEPQKILFAQVLNHLLAVEHPTRAPTIRCNGITR